MPIEPKSEADAENKISSITVEELVNPDSPNLSDEVIQTIHEAALLVSETKIVLKTILLMKLQKSK